MSYSGEIPVDDRNRRFESERQYFDSHVYSHERVHDETIDRYVRGRWPWFHPDYPYSLLRRLVCGKNVLEIGCAEGTNSILLALLGAKAVTGVDISPMAVEAAKERAQKHGLTNCEFIAAPLEIYLKQAEKAKFDVICGWAILHHLLPELEQVLVGLKGVLRPDGTLLFAAEPMNLQPWLRRLRMQVRAVPVEGTDDERPLEARDLEVLRRVFPATEIAMFRGLGRADRIWSNMGFQLMLGAIDYALLRLPGIKELGSVAVITCARGE
jgi:2-polyprenyl-3-methyl-5-hydroxy-6-metoxy-1,4-benzoquinol methylase